MNVVRDQGRSRFAAQPDRRLVDYWNDGGFGAISWWEELEAELQRRGYVTRSSDPADGQPRAGGERLQLAVIGGRR